MGLSFFVFFRLVLSFIKYRGDVILNKTKTQVSRLHLLDFINFLSLVTTSDINSSQSYPNFQAQKNNSSNSPCSHLVNKQEKFLFYFIYFFYRN